VFEYLYILFYRAQTCTWEISATDSSANIFIDINFLNIEFDASCIYDYLEISESGIYKKNFYIFKGTERSILMISQTVNVTIVLYINFNQVSGFLRVLRFPPSIKPTAMI
jgi:hypothetical protein